MSVRNLACLLIVGLMALSACSRGTTERPQSAEETRKERVGRLTGEGIFVGDREDDRGGVGALGVNSYLWRATLDTLAFMPMASADPFGGVVLTDWYENPNAVGERFKVNALILDKTLRADGVRITVFKQAKNEQGGWVDQPVDSKLARQLEDTILTRARQMRVTQITK